MENIGNNGTRMVHVRGEFIYLRYLYNISCTFEKYLKFQILSECNFFICKCKYIEFEMFKCKYF